MEMEELVKVLIIVLVLGVMIGVIVFLFKGKGGESLSGIKDIFRFGR